MNESTSNESTSLEADMKDLWTARSAVSMPWSVKPSQQNARGSVWLFILLLTTAEVNTGELTMKLAANHELVAMLESGTTAVLASNGGQVIRRS